jgi:hypothetical protein
MAIGQEVRSSLDSVRQIAIDIPPFVPKNL